MVIYSKSHSNYELCCYSCCDFQSGFVVHLLSLSLTLQYCLEIPSAVSSTLWQATLRTSSYDSLPSPVVAEYPCQCSQLVREERILCIALLPYWSSQGEDLGASSINRHCGKYHGSPCERSGIPLVPCLSSQPLGQVLMHCLCIPGR